jgi:hypothetical protein
MGEDLEAGISPGELANVLLRLTCVLGCRLMMGSERYSQCIMFTWNEESE